MKNDWKIIGVMGLLAGAGCAEGYYIDKDLRLSLLFWFIIVLLAGIVGYLLSKNGN